MTRVTVTSYEYVTWQRDMTAMVWQLPPQPVLVRCERSAPRCHGNRRDPNAPPSPPGNLTIQFLRKIFKGEVQKRKDSENSERKFDWFFFVYRNCKRSLPLENCWELCAQSWKMFRTLNAEFGEVWWKLETFNVTHAPHTWREALLPPVESYCFLPPSYQTAALQTESNHQWINGSQK